LHYLPTKLQLSQGATKDYAVEVSTAAGDHTTTKKKIQVNLFNPPNRLWIVKIGNKGFWCQIYMVQSNAA